MRPALLLVYLFTVACASTPSPSSGAAEASAREVPLAEAVVQIQLEAYNERDLDAFLATYAPDVRIYDHPDQLRMSGIDQLRERYGQLFASAPDLNATIGKRIVQGEFVIDHEMVTGFPGRETVHAVAIYQVRNGRIQNVWFIR